MTVLDAQFIELSRGGLEDFARARSDALAAPIAPDRLDEVVENLTILQNHARTFLSVPGGAGVADEGKG